MNNPLPDPGILRAIALIHRFPTLDKYIAYQKKEWEQTELRKGYQVFKTVEELVISYSRSYKEAQAISDVALTNGYKLPERSYRFNQQ